MTVSPRWPQDDTPAPHGVGDVFAANDSDGASSPPTLLRLPNLNPAPPALAAENHMTAADPSEKRAIPQLPIQEPSGQEPSGPAAVSPTPAAPPRPVAPVQPVPGNPGLAEVPEVANHGENVHQSQDRQTENRQSPEQPFSGGAFPNLSNPISDAPVGRSWMEVTQRHGVVVLLLMVVVATAIFTGRDTNIDDSGAAIVDAVDVFGVDDGYAADMPMHDHTHNLQTGVASSPQAAVVPGSNNVFAQHPSQQIAENVDFATSVASLEPPHSTAEPNSVALNGNAQGSSVSNRFSQRFDAKAVSNRFGASTDANTDVQFNPPSLEVLANSLPDGDGMTTPQSDVNQSEGRQFDSAAPVSSKTPVGISDWMRYLPEIPSATSN